MESRNLIIEQERKRNVRELEQHLRAKVSDESVERWLYSMAKYLKNSGENPPQIPRTRRGLRLRHPIQYSNLKTLLGAESRLKEYVDGRSQGMMRATRLPRLQHPDDTDDAVMSKFALDLAQRIVPEYEKLFELTSQPRQPYQNQDFDDLVVYYYGPGYHEGSRLFNRLVQKSQGVK